MQTVSRLTDNLCRSSQFRHFCRRALLFYREFLFPVKNNSTMLCCAVPNPKFYNVARHKPAFQVSTHNDEYGSHPASLANDGSRQTNYAVTVNGCSASQHETNPWWAVDLETPKIVYFVNLTNRDVNGTWHLWYLVPEIPLNNQHFKRVRIVGGWGVETPSSRLQTFIFEWKSALTFNPWAKFQTFRHPTVSFFRSILTLRFNIYFNLIFKCWLLRNIVIFIRATLC